MRVMFLRAFTLVALTIVPGHGTPVSAQAPRPRAVPVAIEPFLPTTAIESLLTTPNLLLVADYYRIDMRFGPNLRIDAVVLDAIDSPARVKGLRVQVRDPESRGRQDGTSYMDLDELVRLSRALTSMGERAERWTQDDRLATELSFTTAGGFRLAIRQSARVPRAFISTGLFDPVVTSIDLLDLPALKHGFDQALTILNSK